MGAILCVTLYFGISASSLVAMIGRSHPSIAAIFSPPFFNFRASYTTGDVLGFRIGMTRAEVSQMIRLAYGRVGMLDAGCNDGEQHDAGLVTINDGNFARTLLASDTVCLWVPDRRLSVIFRIEKDVLVNIVVTRLTMEVI